MTAAEAMTEPTSAKNLNQSAYQCDEPDVSKRFEFQIGSADNAPTISIDLLYKSILIIHSESTGQTANQKVDMTGMKVWPGAELMCDWFIYLHSINRLSSRLIELGAGTGICSILAAKLDKRFVVCTDGEEQVVQLIDRNIHQNQSSDRLASFQLYWGNETHIKQSIEALNDLITRSSDQSSDHQSFDCVFAADVCYPDTDRIAVDALFDTAVAFMTQSTGQTTSQTADQSIPFYLAYYHRSTKTSVEVIDCAVSHNLSMKVIDRSILANQSTAQIREAQIRVRGYLFEFRLMNQTVTQPTSQSTPISESIKQHVTDEFSAEQIALMTSDAEWQAKQQELEEADDLPFGLIDD